MSELLTVRELLLMIRRAHRSERNSKNYSKLITNDYLNHFYNLGFDRGFSISKKNKDFIISIISVLLESENNPLSKGEIAELANTTFNSVTLFFHRQRLFSILEEKQLIDSHMHLHHGREIVMYKIDFSKPIDYAHEKTEPEPEPTPEEKRNISFIPDPLTNRTLYMDWSALAQQQKLKKGKNNHENSNTRLSIGDVETAERAK